MSRQLKRLLLIVAIVGFASAAASGLYLMRQDPPRRDTAYLDPLVESYVLEAVDARFRVQSQGTVAPATETVLSAEVSGAIVEISPKFVAGGVFGKDEVLLRIDATDYEVAVRQAEALVRQRKIEYDGAAELRSQGYRAESEYASAAAALASAEAERARARRNLERTSIRLPYEGIVRQKSADLGQFVTPGTRFGVVFATATAEVRLPLTDQDLAFVDLSGAAEVAATGSADGPAVRLSATQQGELRNWTARIVRSEGVVDETSRVTYAVARVDDPYRLHADGAPLPMGTFVNAVIEGREVAGLVRVPRAAVRGANQLLFLDSDNRISIREVGIVRADSDYAYLADGAASAGDRVVLTTIESPVDGMRVRIVEDRDQSQVASQSREEAP